MTVYVHIQYMMLYVCVTLTVNKQYNMRGVCSPRIVAKVQLQYNFTFTIGCSVLLSICFRMKICVSYVLCIHYLVFGISLGP
jgi:hypothetical protein